MKNFKTAVFGIICAVLMLSLGGCKWGKDDDSKKPTPATGYEITSTWRRRTRTATIPAASKAPGS